jgi:hypothetical protein
MKNVSYLNDFLAPTATLFLSLTDQLDDWIDMNFKKLRQLLSVQGNGSVTSEERPVSSFLRLHISIPCSFELIDSDEEKMVVTADENLQSFVTAVNSGRTLYVSYKDTLKTPAFTTLKIQIYTRQLDTLNIGAEGDVIMTAAYTCASPLHIKVASSGDTALLLSAPNIKLSNQSHGDFKIAGECAAFSAKTQSHGDFDAKGLLAQNVTFNTQSSGNAWLYASESLVIKHGADGFVHYYGDGVLKDVRHHGTGEVKHCMV